MFVRIEFGGNFPEEQMLREMDHFLSEMEARTRAYGGIGDDLGGIGPGPAKKEPLKIPALPTVDDLRK